MKRFACAGVSAFLAGCSPNLSVSQQQFGSSQVMIAPGNLRLITERQRDGQAIVCTEPSPDYAVAFGTKVTANLKVTPPTGGTAIDTAGTSIDRTETVTAGAGRAAAVLALRDGLYAACQAYANGVIGKDAYSLVLSQYGELLAAVVNEKATQPYSNDGLAALVTACISAFDSTRGSYSRNPLLNVSDCRAVLRSLGKA